MLMRLRMLKLGVGNGRQAIKQLCHGVLQYSNYVTVATEHVGYVLYIVMVKVLIAFYRGPIPLELSNEHSSCLQTYRSLYIGP